MKISDNITYAEAIHSQTAKRKCIDNTPNPTQVENMKLMPYNYHCKITQRGISQFTSNNDEGPKLTYWVAIEQNSEFK